MKLKKTLIEILKKKLKSSELTGQTRDLCHKSMTTQ